MKGMLNALLAVVCLGIAIWAFLTFRSNANNLYIVLTVVFALLMVVFGGMFLSGRVNKSEEIHITE